MRDWYAYTGEYLILGHGRAIRQITPHAAALQRLLERAQGHYAHALRISQRREPVVDMKTYVAALLASLAIREFGTGNPDATVFLSAGQVVRLLGAPSIEQVAINLFNGRTASAYAGGDDSAIASRVAQGFHDGELLFLPRDASQEVLDALPGAVVFLLSRKQAAHKAFAGYLRRGAPPVVSSNTVAAISRLRPVLRTWEREARLKKEGRASEFHAS